MRATVRRSGLRSARRLEAHWLGKGKLVAAGSAGVSLVNTATWASRVIDRAALAARVVAGRIVTYDGVEVDRGDEGLGLKGYAADGRRRFHVLDGQQVTFVHVVGRRPFAQTERRVHAVDPATGRRTGSFGARRTEIQVLDRPHR
jgi:hypothetical protein